MEYRELGRQQKHINGVSSTLSLLNGRIDASEINPEEKKRLKTAVLSYRKAFVKLTQLDSEIAVLMDEANHIMGQLTPAIQQAVDEESKVMEQIRERSQASSRLHNIINLVVIGCMVIMAVILVAWMVSRLGGKVSLIGSVLAQIAKGNFDVSISSPPKSQRDELDQIAYDVGVVATSLQETMGQLHSRNTELEAISKKLAKYLSPQVYASIFSGRQEVLIQSQRKKLTIFFSDIVGFTSTTDSMESEELTTLLNAYLNEMSKIALDYGGTIDKFIGDAIMIFFGDPESSGDKADAMACVSMAITMRDRLRTLRKIWRDEQGFSRPFSIRIGITTGYCTVGNFGSDERMDYTIIGGNVNLASRLEHKADPDSILISHETYALVKDKIVCTPQEEIQVKGISHPVSTYRVEGFVDSASEFKLQLELTGEGFAVKVDSTRLDTQKRAKLASKLEDVAYKLRQQVITSGDTKNPKVD
ncbi:MAG: adenylate cyclase [Magnetococcales bacterium]|nr:adenylate cyclase [Magnetococcales bacterium]